ncbi:hypothetical protein K2X30_01200 [bacterium]|nr:hypothetical protein [bacterium]
MRFELILTIGILLSSGLPTHAAEDDCDHHYADLQAYLKQHTELNSEVLDIQDGKISVQTVLLESRQGKFLQLLGAAIKNGRVTEIQAGNVVAPKILSFFVNAKRYAPQEGSCKVKGLLNPTFLKTMAQAEKKLKSPLKPDGTRNPNYWSDADKKRFDAAWKNLKIEEACRKFYPAEPCDDLVFEFDVRDPTQIQWRRP